MEFTIRKIDYEVNEWSLTKAIAEVLHADDFYKYPDSDERAPHLKPLNFRVTLTPSQNGGLRNAGTGSLVVPSRKVGSELLRWLDEGNAIRVGKQNLKFYPNSQAKVRRLGETLEKTPYIDPDIDQERQQKLRSLNFPLRIDKVQFGVFYRPRPEQPKRNFAVEWERSYEGSQGWLKFEYEHELIRAELGNKMTEAIGHSIVIRFTNISKIGVGYDFANPYLCFDLFTPPILQEEDFNRELTGDEKKDGRKFRRRVGSLHDGHAQVAPYAHQLRVLLYNPDDVATFARLCNIAGLRKPIGVQIDAQIESFFTPKQIYRIKLWLKSMDWETAFQLEAMLHNGLVNTKELMVDLYDSINKLYRDRPIDTSNILRHFTEALQSRPVHETSRQCFERTRVKRIRLSSAQSTPGMFLCHHITFTPTRQLLEGPYPTQSNRVIRQFPGFEGHFIRVEFREEEKVRYRWDRDVDGASFLQGRVGWLLKNGFELGGREFEFLAYSSSALRSHQVWFMNPFVDSSGRFINADRIRKGLGDFSGVIRYPSKYAARISQAFTATDPSNIRITRDQWEEIPDIGEKPYLFTDGVGTISSELGDKLWAELCKSRRDQGKNAIKPSAYQIRFLGCKGVVAIDPELTGIKMCLRPSMNKFKGNEENAQIEIARAFERPGLSYLNRSIIMVMEDLGVKKDAFLALQNEAVAEARTINDSLDQFCRFLKAHRLGNNFRLLSTMEKLKELGLDIKHNNPSFQIDNLFLSRVRQFSMNHVLRDIKHGARIPIPKSHLLVGVADEGPAYKAAGYKNVFCIPEGRIYACIQRPEDPEPTWLEKSCIISRSPVVHPGDVQRSWAIGKPPADKLCLFRNLKNVVVFSSLGKRSLASCLAGGDLDGDIFDIIQEPSLLFTDKVEPAEYPPGEPRELDREGESTVEDISDFVVEYINSDVLGLLSDKHLTIADQSKHGTQDDACIKLAEMCSQAVDYPKNGIPVNIDDSPRQLIPYKPDWHAAEVDTPRPSDYYISTRALGELFRNITLEKLDTKNPVNYTQRLPLTDPISLALKPSISRQVRLRNGKYADPDGKSADILQLFHGYKDELQFISLAHTITSTPGDRLQEEEIVVGTILANCSEKRHRRERTFRMQVHVSTVVHDIQRVLLPDPQNPTIKDLQRAWDAWDFGLRNIGFGTNSFCLIALAVIFDCLDKLQSEHK